LGRKALIENLFLEPEKRKSKGDEVLGGEVVESDDLQLRDFWKGALGKNKTHAQQKHGLTRKEDPTELGWGESFSKKGREGRS